MAKGQLEGIPVFSTFTFYRTFFWDLACSEEAKEREARMLVVVVPKFAPTVTA